MSRKFMAVAAAAAALVLVTALPASGSQIQLSGEQTAVDGQPGVYEMTGSLVGDWYTDSLECHLIPGGGGIIWPCSGEETFIGCLDESGDGTCLQEGDDNELRFTFTYTGTPVGNGRCHHPIVDGSGTGQFEGASGLLTFKDRLGVCGLETTYKGHISFS